MSFPSITRSRKRKTKTTRLNDSGTKNLLRMFEHPNEGKRRAAAPQAGDARLEFFNTYRNIKRIEEIVSLKKIKSSPHIAFLSQCEKDRLQPRCSGFLSGQGKEGRFSLGRNSLSERYVGAFSHALSEVKSLKIIDLNRNQLSDKSVSFILKNAPALLNLKEVNLSYNSIGPSSLDPIIALLKNNESSLKSLDLEGCALRDSDVATLCEGLSLNNSVTSLNLAKNGLKERAGCALGTMLKNHCKLKRLDLHWNELSQNGASELFLGLAVNQSVAELDLSWNSLGINCSGLLEPFGEFLRTNRSVKHLDISYNSLGLRDCEALAELLCENHTILGLHVLGNSCYVDSLGFLIPTDVPLISLSRHPDKRILISDKNTLEENCWICEKWIETIIVYPTIISKSSTTFIHFEIDGFIPVPMTVRQKQVVITRVLPDRPVRLFFSEISGKVLPLSKLKQEKATPPTVHLLNYTSDQATTVKVAKLNILRPNGFECELKEPFETLPRTPLPQYKEPEASSAVVPWDFANSIFKDYVLDSPELLTRCFEFDWKHSKIANLFFRDFEDLEVSKQLLRQSYPLIKDAYRILSMNSLSEIFTLSSNTLFEFLSAARLLNDSFGAADLGVNWNAVIQAKVKGQKYNPGNALVRYEFLEFLVRVAIDTHLKSGKVQKISEAIEKLLDLARPHFLSCGFQDWRADYFCEEIDFIFKNNENLLRIVFNRFSGKKTLPACAPFMSLEEFRELAVFIGCLNDGSTTRDVDSAFAAAMMTQEDELYKKKHMEMNFIEFLEALARLASTMSFATSPARSSPGRELSLYERVECLMPLLLNITNSYMLTRRTTLQRTDSSVKNIFTRQNTLQS